MITYYNHTHMTAVPTRLLLDTNLSAEAKLTGALLYTFEDGGLSAQELADVLTLPPEKVAPVFAELTDYTEQKKLAAAVSRIATNINHVCRRINSTGHFYDADVAELKERMADVWELLKVQQRNEL